MLHVSKVKPSKQPLSVLVGSLENISIFFFYSLVKNSKILKQVSMVEENVFSNKS